MITVISKSAKETQKLAKVLAREIRPTQHRDGGGAVVIALEGNLGSGKTTFVQGFARALGIKENILSPTFVLLKIYEVSPRQARRILFRQARRILFKHLIHLDCYRLDSPKDLAHLGFGDLLKDKDAVILIEWAERVRKFIPKDAVWIRFKHAGRPHERIMKIRNPKFEIRNKFK